MEQNNQIPAEMVYSITIEAPAGLCNDGVNIRTVLHKSKPNAIRTALEALDKGFKVLMIATPVYP